MKHPQIPLFIAAIAASSLLLPCAQAARQGARQAARFEREIQFTQFFKGNTHTHSNRSDGDSDPHAVMRWYRDQGYHFLAMTDHNLASRSGEFSEIETSSFISIPGEEISWAYTQAGRNPSVHVNSLCATRTVEGRRTDTAVQALREIMRAVSGQRGAIAQINHPNYEWALTESDIANGFSGATLLEVFNQHPHVKNDGDLLHPGVETIWDGLLTDGIRLWGVATDDMHDLVSHPGFTPRRPGHGWVQVASNTLTPEAICQSLDQGRFYSSNGVTLSKIQTTGAEFLIDIVPGAGEVAAQYKTDFIGRGGAILATVSGIRPRYTLRGTEAYVRARVSAPSETASESPIPPSLPFAPSRTKFAWTQPMFVTPAR